MNPAGSLNPLRHNMLKKGSLALILPNGVSNLIHCLTTCPLNWGDQIPTLGDKVSEENAIPVSAVLLPDFSQLTEAQRMNFPSVSLSATELDLGTLAPNEKKSKNIIVRNNGTRDLEITDLQVFNSALGVHLKKRVLKPGASTKLKITAYGQYIGKLKRNPRVMMITNDPNRPKIVVDVKVTSK